MSTKNQLSKIAVENFISKIVSEYKYKPLPNNKSILARQWFIKKLPDSIKLDGEICSLYSTQETLITNSYNRIVVGDYGAFIEFEDVIPENIIIPKEQQYRQSANYINNVKYLWYTTIDNSRCKIYYQLKTVNYADYKIGKYYISPYEVKE